MRRRRFQRGGLSQRKRNGRLFWYLQWREDGQPRSKELGPCSGMTHAQAEVLRAAVLEPINNGLLKPSKPVYTFAQFVESVYLPVSRRKWKESTAMTTETLIGAHLVSALGPRLLRSLVREDLQALLDREAAAGRSASIVNHLRWQMHAIFRLAMGDGAISVNPTLGLAVPVCKVPREKKVLSWADILRAQKALPNRERLIFRLATIEGMRPGEILGLQLRDLRERSVRVERRVYRGDVDSPKMGRAREVALSSASLSLLKEWIPLLEDQRPEAWVFQSENPASPISRDNVQRRHIQPKLTALELGWVTFQVMRRTNGSLAHKRGVDPKVAADQRGHGLGIALEVYTQTDLEKKPQAVKKLSLRWFNRAVKTLNAVIAVNCGSRKFLKRWSGRRDSNPRRPAWEVTRHSNLNNLESAGVGLESTERPGKSGLYHKRPLNGVQLECSGAKRLAARFTRSIWNIDRNSPTKRLVPYRRFPAP
jgi:integrase